MQNEALYSKNSYLVSKNRSGCMREGGKGTHRPSTDAVQGASNIWCCFYGAEKPSGRENES